MEHLRKRLAINRQLQSRYEPYENKRSRTQEMSLNFNMKQRNKGISIIIPVYKGEAFLHSLIQNLNRVHTSNFSYEIIFIVNGTKETVERDSNILNQQLADTEISAHSTVLYSEQGASIARNEGIRHASFNYITFLDCDDYLSEHFIERASQYIDGHSIIAFNIKNVDDNDEYGKNVINEELKKFNQQSTQEYLEISKALSMNGAKLIPTQYVQSILFDEHLKSGEDVVLMMNLLSKFHPNIFVSPSDELVYYRRLTQNSVSRKILNYQFNIIERYQVIMSLAKLLSQEDDEKMRMLIMNRMDAQAGFINQYLKQNPSDYQQVIHLFDRLEEEYLPFQAINKNLKKDLVIAYCFAPYSDTSGIVMSKRIRERGRPCDIISNDMSSVRRKDYSLHKIYRPYVSRHFELNTLPSFSNWEMMQAFVKKGFNRVRDTSYEKIYSRVLWPASHFLAYEIKKKHPESHWIAEFSDPILFDIKNNKRNSTIRSRRFVNTVKKATPSKWHKYINNNLFDMTEIIPFIFADELVFTNELQLQAMIARIDDETLVNLIKDKAVIQPHPTLEESFYQAEEALVAVDQSNFNIGYFGNFYETRGLDEIKYLIEHPEELNTLNPLQLPIKINIFTSNPEQQLVKLYSLGLAEHVEVHSYLSFFEFLHATQLFDALMVMDAHTKPFKPFNPYLPSKLSDYYGSKKPIIAFVEKGSPMYYLENESILKFDI